MEIREYDMMTDEARGIRTAVFVVEKDYRPEFDEWDEPGRATHLLAFGNGRAVATCRLYPDLDHADQPGRWVIGRLAVVADERGHGIGDGAGRGGTSHPEGRWTCCRRTLRR